jgi:hypothetical protein
MNSRAMRARDRGSCTRHRERERLLRAGLDAPRDVIENVGAACTGELDGLDRRAPLAPIGKQLVERPGLEDDIELHAFA